MNCKYCNVPSENGRCPLCGEIVDPDELRRYELYLRKMEEQVAQDYYSALEAEYDDCASND